VLECILLCILERKDAAVSFVYGLCAAQLMKKRSFFVASAARVFLDVVVWIARLTDVVVHEVCTS
jgi:hypothetical protein